MEKFTQIAFELSNRCNYSHIHKECPTKSNDDPIFLPSKIIEKVVCYLGSINYNGEIYFNLYNEPLIDPRLFTLMDYTYYHSPNSWIHIFTNGWNLNQELLEELFNRGKVRVTVSTYSDKEDKRLQSLNCPKEFYNPRRMELSTEVLSLYDQEPNCTGPCLFPSIYPIINHKAELILCCRDWKYQHVFADLNKVTIQEALEVDLRNRICEELKNGVRSLDLCKRCHFKGWGIP
jgi:hypothetical protein